MNAGGSIFIARRLGEPYGIKVATVQERADPAVPGVYVDAYLVYWRGARMGKRRDPAGALALVRKLIRGLQAGGSHAAA